MIESQLVPCLPQTNPRKPTRAWREFHAVHGSRCPYQFLGWGQRWILVSRAIMTTKIEFQNKLLGVMWQGRIVFPVKMVWRHLYTIGKYLHRRIEMYSLSRSAPTGTWMHLTHNQCIMCVDSKSSKKAILSILTPHALQRTMINGFCKV